MKYIVDVNGERHDTLFEDGAVTIDGIDAPATIDPNDGTPVRIVRIGDRVVRIVSRPGEQRGSYILDIDGYKYTVDALDERTRTIRDMTAKAAAAAGPAPLKAPMPGLIVRVNVHAGEVVEAGQGLVVMEAMKMENELRATVGGTIKAVLVEAGAAVEKGQLLVELE
jgi:pyruvate carboxylase subunit B